MHIWSGLAALNAHFTHSITKHICIIIIITIKSSSTSAMHAPMEHIRRFAQPFYINSKGLQSAHVIVSLFEAPLAICVLFRYGCVVVSMFSSRHIDSEVVLCSTGCVVMNNYFNCCCLAISRFGHT